MPRQFSAIAFTPAVKAMQEKMGSRENYERFVVKGPDNNTINSDLERFISIGLINGCRDIDFREEVAQNGNFQGEETWSGRSSCCSGDPREVEQGCI